MKEYRRKIANIESGAYYAAAEVLLIGLRHIREHRMTYPIGTTDTEWFDEIVPELIWYCEQILRDEWSTGAEYQQRMNNASRLLGEHFQSIWC